MAPTTGQSGVPAPARWHLLLRPRWLAWHSFVVVATVGMLLLGDWQLHRAEAGNELSWAYTFEWPLFAAFTVYFWIKSLHDELREHGAAAAAGDTAAKPAAGSAAGASEVGAADSAGSRAAARPASPASPATTSTAAGQPSADPMSGATAGDAAGVVEAPRPAAAGRRAASWDATSWDAASWDATGQPAGPDGSGKRVDVARATPADGDAYVARLMAEVQRPGRRARR
jgi:hypothetical protein